MNRWLTRMIGSGLGAVGVVLLPLASAQDARTNGASGTGVIHPALAMDVAELIVPAGKVVIQTQGAPPTGQSLAMYIVDRSMIEGGVTLEGLRRLQERPDRFEIRIRKARLTSVTDAGDGIPQRFLLTPLTASPIEVELVLPASTAPKGGAGDRAVEQPARKLRWLQLEGSATFTWTDGVELRLHQAHATLASIPDEGFQAPRLLFVESLHSSQVSK